MFTNIRERAQPFDVVLLDYKMPFNGMDLAKDIEALKEADLRHERLVELLAILREIQKRRTFRIRPCAVREGMKFCLKNLRSY